MIGKGILQGLNAPLQLTNVVVFSLEKVNKPPYLINHFF